MKKVKRKQILKPVAKNKLPEGGLKKSEAKKLAAKMKTALNKNQPPSAATGAYKPGWNLVRVALDNLAEFMDDLSTGPLAARAPMDLMRLVPLQNEMDPGRGVDTYHARKIGVFFFLIG